MFQNLELYVGDKLIRGDVRLPDQGEKFPTVCFFHGFCVDRIGLMRLHELFARRCAESGIACVKFDFYGCGESDGDFSEMRYTDEKVQAQAIYEWTKNQQWCDTENMFLVGHSLGGAVASNIAPIVQPKAIILWAPGNYVYYDISSRVHAVPGNYQPFYDIGGLTLSSEFLEEVRRINIVEDAKGYNGKVLIIHGEEDEKVPIYASGLYMDMYGEKADFKVIAGANHQFSAVEWKNKVYDLSLHFIKERCQ